MPDQPEEQLLVAEPNHDVDDVAVPLPSQPLIPGLPTVQVANQGVRYSAACKKRQEEFLSGTPKPSLEESPLAEGELEDAPYSPSLGPEPIDHADVGMELPLPVSSTPAEAASFSEHSTPEVAQEDVAMDFEATEDREPMDISSMIDVCQCLNRCPGWMFDITRFTVSGTFVS